MHLLLAKTRIYLASCQHEAYRSFHVVIKNITYTVSALHGNFFEHSVVDTVEPFKEDTLKCGHRTNQDTFVVSTAHLFSHEKFNPDIQHDIPC